MIDEDDDRAAAIVTPDQGLLTSESGTRATFTVRLAAKPYDDVTLALGSTNPAEGVPDRASLVFTPNNWDLPQIVAAIGVDDAIADGAQPYGITIGPAASADLAYAAMHSLELPALNADDDVQAIVAMPASGLVTTEAGGTATFSVVLGSQPTADVTVPIASSLPGEISPSVAALVFTPDAWNLAQDVTLTGLDDRIVDGDRDVTIDVGPASSADPRYAGLPGGHVHATNLDDDTPGLVATPAHGLVTGERGLDDHFTVVLHSQPIAAVTVPIASTDPGEGSVYPATLVFSPTDWDQPQTVTVRGIDDVLADGDIAYAVTLGPASSADPVYAGLDADPIDATNLDNDRAGFVIAPAAVTVSEFADTDTFTLALAHRPTATVRVNVSSSDLTEGFVAPAQLVFTPTNWNNPRTVTVTGVDDLLADGNQAFQIILAPAVSTDPAYADLDPPDVAAMNVDNELAQVYVKARPLLATSESGLQATYRIRLTVAPTAAVVCPVTSADPSEGIANPAGVTFGPASFGFQTVAITGIDDALPDGDQLYTVLDGACTSTDPAYAGADPPDVRAVNREND